MQTDKRGKHLTKILREMCSRVDADYDSMDFKSQDWFTQYTWTEINQNNFKTWMVEYLVKHKDAQDELLASYVKTKRIIEKAVDWFVFDYGWKKI